MSLEEYIGKDIYRQIYQPYVYDKFEYRVELGNCDDHKITEIYTNWAGEYDEDILNLHQEPNTNGNNLYLKPKGIYLVEIWETYHSITENLPQV
jgi:hypothetical protein